MAKNEEIDSIRIKSLEPMQKAELRKGNLGKQYLASIED
jgi:hypothetical protein